LICCNALRHISRQLLHECILFKKNQYSCRLHYSLIIGWSEELLKWPTLFSGLCLYVKFTSVLHFKSQPWNVFEELIFLMILGNFCVILSLFFIVSMWRRYKVSHQELRFWCLQDYILADFLYSSIPSRGELALQFP